MKNKVENKAWSRGKLEDVAHCPACGSLQKTDDKYCRHGESKKMPDLWHFSQCLDCQSLYLNPRPDAASLPLAYDDYFTHSADSEKPAEKGIKGFFWRLIHGYLNRRFGMNRLPENKWGYYAFFLFRPLRLKLDYFGRHLFKIKKGRLLDIGCGNGTFLLRAKEMGWLDIMGCEPDAAAVNICKEQGLNVIEGNAFLPALDTCRFDVITMGHIIEHVDDPLALLKRACSLLEDGGTLWLATPNSGSMTLSVFGSAWVGFQPPYHLCVLSQPQLTKLLEKAGFDAPVFQRRGSHIKYYCRESVQIAKQEGISSAWLNLFRYYYFIFDFISSYFVRRADETVLIARKAKK